MKDLYRPHFGRSVRTLPSPNAVIAWREPIESLTSYSSVKPMPALVLNAAKGALPKSLCIGRSRPRIPPNATAQQTKLLARFAPFPFSTGDLCREGFKLLGPEDAKALEPVINAL